MIKTASIKATLAPATGALAVLVSSPTNKRENKMRTLTTMIVIALIVFTARASEPVPYVAMPIDKGYGIDAHGKRQPNALCVRDIIWARAPSYPLRAQSSDPTTWSRNFRGDGLYRLDIDLKNRSSKPSYNHEIDRFRGSGPTQHSGLWPMGFHARKVVSNDNSYHCAHNLGACSNSGAIT
jgi:hypothetical protein